MCWEEFSLNPVRTHGRKEIFCEMKKELTFPNNAFLQSKDAIVTFLLF